MRVEKSVKSGGWALLCVHALVYYVPILLEHKIARAKKHVGCMKLDLIKIAKINQGISTYINNLIYESIKKT